MKECSPSIDTDMHSVYHKVTLRALYAAWRQARRKKKPSFNQLAFELDWLARLLSLQQQLTYHRWQAKATVCFVATHPKTREIHAPDFSDRVVHHYVVPQLEALFEPVFIFDSYANRKHKGSHQAVKRLQQWMRRQPQACYLQLDIHNFFNSIHRPTLYQLLKQRLDKSLSKGRLPLEQHHHLKVLCHTLCSQQPASTAYYRGGEAMHALVPAHKSLKNAKKHCGLAVGNLSSQFFANVYLNELDQFVKHGLKCKAYVRYVDDFILIHESPEQLFKWRKQIVQFLAQHLQLRLKMNANLGLPDPQPLKNGIDFLGYISYPTHRVVRRRVIRHCYDKLSQAEHQLLSASATENISQHLRLNAENKVLIQGLVASYWGHFSHASHWRLTQRVLKRFPWLEQCFAFQPGALPKLRFACGTQNFMQDQIAYFRQMYPDALLQVQKGYRWLPYWPKGGVAQRIVTIQECGYLKHGLKRREVVAIQCLFNPLINHNYPVYTQRSPYENLSQNLSLSA